MFTKSEVIFFCLLFQHRTFLEILSFFIEQHTENTTFKRKWGRDYPGEVFWRERIEKARSRIFCSHYQDAGQDPTA
jgi:hypothetical protein